MSSPSKNTDCTKSLASTIPDQTFEISSKAFISLSPNEVNEVPAKQSKDTHGNVDNIPSPRVSNMKLNDGVVVHDVGSLNQHHAAICIQVLLSTTIFVHSYMINTCFLRSC